MTVETHLLREIADRVIEARNAKTALDIDATALALSRNFSGSALSVADIRDKLEQAAIAQGAAILSDNSSTI